MQEIASGLNVTMRFNQPLPRSEVRGIVKSVANWTWKHFTPQTFNKIQRARIKKRWKDHTPLSVSKPWEAEGISRATWYRQRKANGQA